MQFQASYYPASAVRTLFLSLLFSLASLAQSPAHLLRAGAGASLAHGGWKTYSFSASPVLDFNYGLRPWRYIQFDAGAVLDRQTYPDCYKSACTDSRRDLLFLPAGLRGVLPLFHDRLELSAGAGGAYLHDFYYGELDEGLLQIYGGLSTALDSRHRYRLDILTRHFRDPGRPTQTHNLLTFGFTWCPNCR